MTFDEWLSIIDNEVNFFVQEFNEDYTAEMGADFCCYPMLGEIEWSLLIVDEAGLAFYENFCSRYEEVESFNIFTLSLLHEIGHLETLKARYLRHQAQHLYRHDDKRGGGCAVFPWLLAAVERCSRAQRHVNLSRRIKCASALQL